MSLSIKDPKVNRDKDNYLFRELKRLNDWIDKAVRKESYKINTVETRAKFTGGIVFPYRFGDDMNPFVILGCIPELASIFETKARAPFKIVFEVCRLNELIEEVEVQMRAEQEEIPLDADPVDGQDQDKQIKMSQLAQSKSISQTSEAQEAAQVAT